MASSPSKLWVAGSNPADVARKSAKAPDYADGQNFFDTVIQPVVKDNLRFRLVVIDARHAHEHARVDQELFAKLHPSDAVFR
jgi:hypothetical protein